MSAARGFARNKPIIVLKPGRYAESAAAALSHTGSMAGGDEIYEAAFRREGVVRVHEVADLFHAAAVLDSHRLPQGRDVAIVTNAGGLGVMATDCARRARRAARVPLGRDDGDAQRGAAAVLEPRQPDRRAGRRGQRPLRRRRAGVPRRRRASTASCSSTRRRATRAPTRWPSRSPSSVKGSDKPVITVLMGGETVRNGRRIFSEAGIPSYETPEDAVKTYLGMYRYSRNLELLYETPVRARRSTSRRRATTSRRCCAASPRPAASCSPRRSRSASSPPTACRSSTQRTAHSVEEALAAAEEIGYPVVLKIVSHDITHKNAAGGVEVGICSAAGPRARLRRDAARASQEREPDATIEGISVQKMVRKRRLRAHPRHEEGPAVRLGHRVRRRRRAAPRGSRTSR